MDMGKLARGSSGLGRWECMALLGLLAACELMKGPFNFFYIYSNRP